MVDVIHDAKARTQLSEERCRLLLISIRKIIHQLNIQSKNMDKQFGLTGPQLIILQEIANSKKISITPLSKSVSLSQATVTVICRRLEKKGYLIRNRGEDDKRSVWVSLTEKGNEMLLNLPPLVQDIFADRFSNIQSWEKMMILSAFERVVELMSLNE